MKKKESKNHLAFQAFSELFPSDNPLEYQFTVKYSGKFSSYNANVSYRARQLNFSLSKKWEEVNDDIQIGLIQSLLVKIFKKKQAVKENKINLYSIFLKQIHIAVPKDNQDPILKQSFDKINDEYFHGMLDPCNLVWGDATTTKLGCYEYGTDTITMSKIFQNIEPENQPLLDLVMYHEMLHKKHKFTHTGQRSCHHTPEFRREEQKFENFEVIEKRLNRFAHQKKREKSKRWGWF